MPHVDHIRLICRVIRNERSLKHFVTILLFTSIVVSFCPLNSKQTQSKRIVLCVFVFFFKRNIILLRHPLSKDILHQECLLYFALCRIVERERESRSIRAHLTCVLWKKREKKQNAYVKDESIHHCWINNPFGCVLNKHLRNYKSIWKYPIFRCLMNASESKKRETASVHELFFCYGCWLVSTQKPKRFSFISNPKHFRWILNIDRTVCGLPFGIFSMDCLEFLFTNDRKIWIYFKRFKFIFWGFIHRNGIRLKCKWNLNYDAYQNATDMQPTQNGNHGGYKQTYFKCHCWKYRQSLSNTYATLGTIKFVLFNHKLAIAGLHK